MKKLLSGLAALALAGAVFGGVSSAENACDATPDEDATNQHQGGQFGPDPDIGGDFTGTSGYIATGGSNGHFELTGDSDGLQGDGMLVDSESGGTGEELGNINGSGTLGSDGTVDACISAEPSGGEPVTVVVSPAE